MGMLLLAGCVSAPPLPMRDAKVRLVWPRRPERPRIEYLRDIKSPEEVLPEKGRVARFVEYFTGEHTGDVGDFVTPYGITTSGGDVIYVADPGARVVFRLDLAKREVTPISEAGDVPLLSPVGVALDSEGHLYVTDSILDRVFKFNAKGEYLGELKGKFERPAGIAINSRGEKFVVDVLAHKLKVYDKDDRFERDFPPAGEGGALNLPSNVAIDRDNNVYLTDSLNFTIKMYDREGKFLGKVGQIGDSPGFFARPKGVAVDSVGHIYVVDASHSNFQIFNRKGRLLLYVGGEGGGAGEFSLPSGIFIDRSDRIFVVDTYNRRIQIFRYLKEGGAQ